MAAAVIIFVTNITNTIRMYRIEQKQPSLYFSSIYSNLYSKLLDWLFVLSDIQWIWSTHPIWKDILAENLLYSFAGSPFLLNHSLELVVLMAIHLVKV